MANRADGTTSRVDKILITLLLLSIFQLPVLSQSIGNDDYLANYFSTREGLPYDKVEHIFKDSDGFLWVSTFGGGVARYDGNSIIPINSHTLPGMKSDRVVQACEDAFGRLWIASSEGINILDKDGMAFCKVDDSVEAVSDGHLVNGIGLSADGCIWFNSVNSLFRVSFAEDGDVERVDRLDDSEQNMGLRPAFCDVDGDGSIWTSHDGDLCKVSYSEGFGLRPFVIDIPGFEHGEKITAFQRQNNTVWIGTHNGLYRFDEMKGSVKLYRHDQSDVHSLSNNHINSLALTADGRLAVATMMGLSIYDSQNDRFVVYTSEENEFGSKVLNSNIVRSVTAVGEQIWIGTDTDGIAILKKKRLPFSEIKHRENDETSLKNSTVSAVFFDSNGTQWVGTFEDGLFRSTGSGYRYKSYTTENSALYDNTVNSISQDAYGTLWVGTMNAGINLIDINNPDRIHDLDADPKVLSLIDNVNAFAYDHINDCMWICSRTGLFNYDFKTKQLSQYSSEYKLCFGATIDHLDRLLVTYQNGLLCIDLKTMELRDYHEPGLSVSAVSDADGTIWIASFDNGLYKAVDNQGVLSFEHLTTENGLVDNRLRGLLLEGNNLWITTNNGLSRLNTKKATIDSFSSYDGLENTDFYNNAVCMGPDMALYFGQKKGMTVLWSRYIPPITDVISRIAITDMSIGNERVDVSSGKRVKLHGKDRNIAFQFADLSFEDSKAVEYRYRIEPFDKEWQTADRTTKLIRFATLHGGDQKLHVQAVDPIGKILSEDEIDLNVKPIFYRSIWFILLLFIFALGSVYLVMRARTQVLKMNETRLQQEVERQTALLSEKNRELERQTAELLEQNKILMKQNEALAGRKMVANTVPSAGAPERDSKFIDKLMNVIRDHYKNPDLDVTVFCEAMCMCHSTLNKKVHDSFNQSIGQFIRSYRLNVAKEILENNVQEEMNISDVAYEVGFNDPKYFTRCFSKEFGITPSYYQGVVIPANEELESSMEDVDIPDSLDEDRLDSVEELSGKDNCSAEG